MNVNKKNFQFETVKLFFYFFTQMSLKHKLSIDKRSDSTINEKFIVNKNVF